mgnify:FL=1
MEKLEGPKEAKQEQASDLPRGLVEKADSSVEKKPGEYSKGSHDAIMSRFQGDIGEGIAERVSTEKLNLTPDPRFDAKRHGFDSVGRDDKGKLVIVEAKCDERGIKALRKDQMQQAWVERNAQMMQNPGNERFTQGNAEIGHEIQRTPPEDIRRVVLSLDPRTLEITGYEADSAGKWQVIGRWSALEFEQPTL